MTTTYTPGTEVRYTVYGRKGIHTGTLNGYSFVDGYGTLASIRTPLGVVRVPANRVL